VIGSISRGARCVIRAPPQGPMGAGIGRGATQKSGSAGCGQYEEPGLAREAAMRRLCLRKNSFHSSIKPSSSKTSDSSYGKRRIFRSTERRGRELPGQPSPRPLRRAALTSSRASRRRARFDAPRSRAPGPAVAAPAPSAAAASFPVEP